MHNAIILLMLYNILNGTYATIHIYTLQICATSDSPARVEMALADGPPEESFAAIAGRRPVVFASRPVAADGARLVLIGHGRRVYLRRVDGLQIGLFAVYRHAVEVRFCYKSVSLN